uniref:guanylate-binding protein 1-like n=1 Tax=Pristiophorus japonicus TaxID=55135 RepID=UPI00398EF488
MGRLARETKVQTKTVLQELDRQICLSSVFVFNSQGTINQQSMRDLHFVTELAKRIQVKSQPDGGEERDFIQFFPDFVWSLRDLTLDLEINGTDVTADQYLENSLRLRNETTERDQDYNNLRRCIRNYFPTRRCFGFVCPATRKDLKQLQELADDQLDQEFVAEFRKFSEYIYTSGKVKTVLGGHQVTGRRLIHLAMTYVDAIAKGELPCVESGIARMAELENSAAVKRALEYYDRKVAAIAQPPAHIDERLTDLFTYYHNDAKKVFMKHSLKDDTGKHNWKLEESLRSRYGSIVAKVESESLERCEALLLEVMGSAMKNLGSGYYLRPVGYRELEDALEIGIKQFKAQTVEEVKGTDVLAHLLRTVKPYLAAVLMMDSMMPEKEHSVPVLHALIENLWMADWKRQSREEQREEEERLRTEEALRQMKEQFEEEMEKSWLQLKEATERKQAERAKYLSERRETEEQKMIDNYKRFSREWERILNYKLWYYFCNYCRMLMGNFREFLHL